MIIIVAYDVVDDTRRNRIAKALKNYGQRIQYSVFECDLTSQQIKSLKAVVKKLINEAEDRVHFFVICQACYEKRQALPANLVTRIPSAILIS